MNDNIKTGQKDGARDQETANHIIAFCEAMEKTIGDKLMNYEAFKQDGASQRAVFIFVSQILAMVDSFTPEYLQQHPDIPVRRMRMLKEEGEKVSHINYLDPGVLWDCATQDIKNLKNYLK